MSALALSALGLLRRQQALDELSPAARAVEERAIAREVAEIETQLVEIYAAVNSGAARDRVAELLARAVIPPIDHRAALILGLELWEVSRDRADLAARCLAAVERLLAAQGDNAEPELIQLQHLLVQVARS